MLYSSLKQAELHVHIIGCYHVEDLWTMAKDIYREINWNRFNFLDRYERIFGVRLDPIAMFERACATGSLDEIRDVAVYKYHPQGRFEEFDIKSFFAIAIYGYYLDRGLHEPLLAPVIKRHISQGLTYAEYRGAFATQGEEFKLWHGRFARYLKEASNSDFTARYIVRLTGPDIMQTYSTLRELLHEQPELAKTIVGVDFSGREIPPKTLAGFYKQLHIDNALDPNNYLDAVVHIGENFYGLSLESAARWCHQSALLGAKRLAHCIALGLDPGAAISRQPEAHTRETVEERLDQIAYDLEKALELASRGICINEQALRDEHAELLSKDPTSLVYRPYNEERLREISLRQDYVLSDLVRLGTIIEACPTSNLCIGGVPSMEAHPFKRLYASGVKLAICTDDPGIFDVTLSDEVDNVCKWFELPPHDLATRLGDPKGFRLAVNRNRL